MRFFFATGIENSYPTLATGVRIDQMEQCGHYARWEEDFALVRELGLTALRYGPPYDVLLSTMPLDKLVAGMDGYVPDVVRSEASRLRHSGSYIVGIGIRQPSPSTKCWIYFPEANCPFYRVTYLSNYSPDMVPDPATHYSLLAEISQSPFKPVNRETIIAETIDGLVNARMISDADRDDIVDAHLIERDYTYPTPSLERDPALREVLPWLESKDIYSRGRFGAWRYEVGNMDHSVAQGVEWANRVICGDVANELTHLAKRGC